ncbi:crosslink repair DNA glycosylase YcaQ family protein [Actinokineospora auranticolor]|uniref:Winged helix DNA-binding protein n=1 Tax=Actinokineospora auranticolor TaxID=155976 RepID=A0A2S6GJ94_9PSEU|nr:crosslink repair DNA glycosylase YcaQ family protein [Actinokineospora auranticolor]PPK65287.1 winged helix DNA-binding protein [Actinokineospora auranticolor]
MKVTRAQVLAHRVARHGLHRETTALHELAVLELGIQDAGGGSPRVAAAARLPEGTDLDDDRLVTVWAHRGAPHLLRRADLPALAAALYPATDADATARLGACGTALRRAGHPGLAAFAAGVAAMHAVVDSPKPRGQVSGEMTALLPGPFAYDCSVCAATHVYGSLFQLVGLAAGVRVRAASRPTVLAPVDPDWVIPAGPAGAGPVADAYLRLHGPATLADLAGFLDTTQTQATPAWPADLAAVDVDGAVRHLPEADLAALRDAPDPPGPRLLPALDPLLQGRDRDLLVPDETHRKRLWKVIGNPGAVLVDGEVVGTWRTKAAGKALGVTVDAFGTLAKTTRGLLDAEAHRAAAARGFAEARVTHT